MTLSERVEKEGGTVSERAARIVCAEIVLALECIHALDVIHRDGELLSPFPLFSSRC